MHKIPCIQPLEACYPCYYSKTPYYFKCLSRSKTRLWGLLSSELRQFGGVCRSMRKGSGGLTGSSSLTQGPSRQLFWASRKQRPAMPIPLHTPHPHHSALGPVFPKLKVLGTFPEHHPSWWVNGFSEVGYEMNISSKVTQRFSLVGTAHLKQPSLVSSYISEPKTTLGCHWNSRLPAALPPPFNPFPSVSQSTFLPFSTTFFWCNPLDWFCSLWC